MGDLDGVMEATYRALVESYLRSELGVDFGREAGG